MLRNIETMDEKMNSPLIASEVSNGPPGYEQAKNDQQVYLAQPLQNQQQTVIVVNATAAPGGDGLIPYQGENAWHYGLCDRCCTCTGECCMAWWCPCISVGQIASKV